MFEIRTDSYCTVTVNDVWPDGDAPENPTVDDVLEVMQQEGRKSRMIENWNLPQPEVTVTDGVGGVARW